MTAGRCWRPEPPVGIQHVKPHLLEAAAKQMKWFMAGGGDPWEQGK